MNENHGLIIPKIVKGDHYVLGGYTKLKGEVINPSGDWTPYLPDKEPQSKNGVETQNCTGYGTNNAIETLLNFKGVETNNSDRALAIAAGTDPYHGNDPHTVAETVRNILGCVPEAILPFSDDIKTPEQYYTPKPLSSSIIKIGTSFYDMWDFAHEWVFQSGSVEEKKAKLKEALTKGTVSVSVFAWSFNGEVYYKPQGATDNHWCQLVKFDEQDRPVIFDSYDNYLKTLAVDFDFAIAKVYYITPSAPKLSLIQQIINAIKAQLPFLFAQVQKKIEEKAVPIIPPDSTMSPPVEPINKPMNPSIKDLAKEIEEFENIADKSLNNPGALRSSPFQAGQRKQKTTGKMLAYFNTYEQGFAALEHQIKIICEGISPAYNSEAQKLGLKDCSLLTLKQFINVYAPSGDSNDPDKYATFVSSNLEIPKSFQMKDFIKVV